MAMVAYQQPVAPPIWPISPISHLIWRNRLENVLVHIIFTYCPPHPWNNLVRIEYIRYLCFSAKWTRKNISNRPPNIQSISLCSNQNLALLSIYEWLFQALILFVLFFLFIFVESNWGNVWKILKNIFYINKIIEQNCMCMVAI